jgi:hypothetical protein
MLTFAFGCASVIVLSRISMGWRMAALAEQQAGAA